ncbi:MAG: GDP-mannose 4,6-dehydratase [Spirochaetota bacterium]|nr:GDP-mannose 4,6-dehydratase [Spirochaetota bacterium]
MKKKALITGIRGQDGAYLSKLLLDKGYEVYGADRRSGDSRNWRINELGAENDVKTLYMDLLEKTNIRNIIEKVQPDEVYNLAAQSFVGISFDQPILTSEIDAIGVLRLLAAIKDIKPDAKFYQASTSEMFGKVQEIPQTESTPFYPRSPYGVAKLFAHWMTINYRESYNMFSCCGILFNHESPLRGLEFVTRKITHGIAKIKNNQKEKIILGNLDAKRDWGYAKEYVEGMWLMLQQDKPDDYILSTGETHSVREFVETACRFVDIDIVWEGEGVNTKGIDKKTGKIIVETSPEFYRPAEVDLLIGDPKKAKENIGWEPKTTFRALVEIMMKADLERVEKGIL